MKTVTTAVATVALLAGGWLSYTKLFAQEWQNVSVQPIVHLPYDSRIIDSQIRVSEDAVLLDPGSALGWSLLSTDYMARSRESDDLATAQKAEAAARRSLKLRTMGNESARNKLAQALLQQHRFKDALAECGRAFEAKIYDDQTVRLRAESLLEIGRYEDARKLIQTNPRAFAGASGQAIAARLLDIQGKPEEALAILKNSAQQADAAPAMPSDAIAWFHTHTALQLAKMGEHPEARAEYLKALTLYPRDYKAMAGLAKLSFQDGQWQEAIDWGTRSDAVAQMADVRALVGDAYAMLGDSTKAEEQYNRVAALVGRPSGMNDGLHEIAPLAGTHGHRLDRQYALFCADHGRDPEGAYAAAIRDFEGRQDIYAFDTLAWVCLKTGRLDEAVKAIGIALKQGDRDPSLFYHAGAIYAAAGRQDLAVRYLGDALAIDPHFDSVAAAKARQMLAIQRKAAGDR